MFWQYHRNPKRSIHSYVSRIDLFAILKEKQHICSMLKCSRINLQDLLGEKMMDFQISSFKFWILDHFNMKLDSLILYRAHFLDDSFLGLIGIKRHINNSMRNPHCKDSSERRWIASWFCVAHIDYLKHTRQYRNIVHTHIYINQ